MLPPLSLVGVLQKSAWLDEGETSCHISYMVSTIHNIILTAQSLMICFSTFCHQLTLEF